MRGSGLLRRLLWRGLLPIHRVVVRGGRPLTSVPRRILLLNGGHFGDVVISSWVIPVLRSAFPEVEIGFASGSWAREVLKDHPEIAFRHTIDHWKLIRAGMPRQQKMEVYRRSREQFLEEITAVGYDWAISLFWKPDFLDLARRAGVPVRAAFAHSFSALTATHLAPALEYSPLTTEGARHADLLRRLGVGEEHLQQRRACLPPGSESALGELDALFPAWRDPAGYCIVHMGAGARVKELKPQFWRELAETLSRSTAVIFTGHGEREAKNIEQAMAGLSNCVNACGRLSWQGLVATVRNASRVYSVDTSIAHLAAAAGTPLEAVYAGYNGVGRWRPEGKDVTVWTQHVFCAPCFKAEGCGEMTCLSGIRPANLLGTAAAGKDGARLPNYSAVVTPAEMPEEALRG